MNIKKLIKEEIDNFNRKYYIEWSAIGTIPKYNDQKERKKNNF